MKLLSQIQNSLSTLNGYQTINDLEGFLYPSEKKNELIIREQGGEAEILLCIQTKILEKLKDLSLPEDFNLKHASDLAIVVEELSHFNTFCFSAERDREVSPLDLEIQGEIDKFGVFLQMLHKRNEESMREKIFALLFENISFKNDLKSDELERYQNAHHIAKNFCRQVMAEFKEWDQSKHLFKTFFDSTRVEKYGLRWSGNILK